MNKVVVLVAVLISFARGAAIGTKTTSTQISTLMSAFTPNTTSPGCIVFTEYVSGYSSGQSMYYSEPADGIAMPNSVVTKLLTTLKAQTKYRCIEIFGIEPTILSLARAQGFKVHGIIWLTLTTSANSVAISNAIRAAKAYPTSLLSLSCGSELAFRSGTGTTVTNIIKNCLASIRGAGITLPVGTQDSLRTFNNGWAAMTPYVDFFGVNIYPWYDNAGGSCLRYTDAAYQTYKRYVNVKAKYPGKPFLVTESGWPGTGGTGVSKGCGIASDANQKYVIKGLTTYFKTYKAPISIFASFREPWKSAGNPSSPGSFYGICKSVSPYTCFNQPTSW